MMNSSAFESTDNQSVQCAIGFIENIWNRKKIEMLSDYLQPGFIDYSLPQGFQSANGLSSYLKELMENVDHQTKIEQVEVKQEFVFIRVRITLCSLSNPKEKKLAGKQSETMTGYRIFAIADGRIAAHWEILQKAA
jgi:predicted SnoaL-like aldol condensation-catalyzing enzyme